MEVERRTTANQHSGHENERSLHERQPEKENNNEKLYSVGPDRGRHDHKVSPG